MLILSTGCATNSAFKHEIDTRVGTSIEDLIRDVGQPNHSPTDSIAGAYEWYYKVTVFKQNQKHTVTCRVGFDVSREGIIEKTNFKGHYCGMKGMPSFEAFGALSSAN